MEIILEVLFTAVFTNWKKVRWELSKKNKHETIVSEQ